MKILRAHYLFACTSLGYVFICEYICDLTVKTHSSVGPLLASVASALDAHTRGDKVGHMRGDKELRKERKKEQGTWRLGKGVIRRKALSFICLSTILLFLLGYSVSLWLLFSSIWQIFILSTISRYSRCPKVITMNRRGKDLCSHIFYSRRCRQAIIKKPIRQPFKWR